MLPKLISTDYRGVVTIVGEWAELRSVLGLTKSPGSFDAVARRAKAPEKRGFAQLMAACCDRGRTAGLIADDDRTAAIDSTGLETRHASMHFQRRCGRLDRNDMPPGQKLTAVFHTASQLIVGAVASRGPSQDSPDFPAAVRQAAVNLRPRRVLADKGYDAEHNHALCRQELGIRSTVIPLNPRNAPGQKRLLPT